MSWRRTASSWCWPTPRSRRVRALPGASLIDAGRAWWMVDARPPSAGLAQASRAPACLLACLPDPLQCLLLSLERSNMGVACCGPPTCVPRLPGSPGSLLLCGAGAAGPQALQHDPQDQGGQRARQHVGRRRAPPCHGSVRSTCSAATATGPGPVSPPPPPSCRDARPWCCITTFGNPLVPPHAPLPAVEHAAAVLKHEQSGWAPQI